MFDTFRFESPLFLLILLVIPLLLFYDKRFKKHPTIKYSSIKIIKLTQKKKIFTSKVILNTLRMLSITLFIISLARPQLAKSTAEVLTEGVSVMLTLDTSGSMQAIDMEIDKNTVTRLEVVKKVVKEFISKRTNDPTGLIVFGSESYTQCPLTLDTNMLTEFVNGLEIGMAGQQTAIGNSLTLAVNRKKNTNAKSKVIILLTDGANTAGQIPPEKAAEIAATYQIKVYTIGIGTTGKIPFLQDSFLGPQVVYGNADLDEQTLKMIANKTNGKYFRAKNTEELQKIYNEIDKLEKTEVKIKKYMQYKELFSYFLIPAILLLLLEIILANTKFLRIP